MEYEATENTVLKKIVVEGDTVTLFTELPPQGYTKVQLLERFVAELSEQMRWHDDIATALLGGVLRVNGRMLTEIALAAGAIAARFGARAVKLYGTNEGDYIPALGQDGVMDMPTPLQPGMIVEINKDSGLFRNGAHAVVLNVGRDSVNIAEPRDGYSYRRRRRDTAWTARENVRAVGWEVTPSL